MKNHDEIENKLDALVTATEELGKTLEKVSTEILSLVQMLNKAFDSLNLDEEKGYFLLTPEPCDEGGTDEN